MDVIIEQGRRLGQKKIKKALLRKESINATTGILTWKECRRIQVALERGVDFFLQPTQPLPIENIDALEEKLKKHYHHIKRADRKLITSYLLERNAEELLYKFMHKEQTKKGNSFLGYLGEAYINTYFQEHFPQLQANPIIQGHEIDTFIPDVKKETFKQAIQEHFSFYAKQPDFLHEGFEERNQTLHEILTHTGQYAQKAMRDQAFGSWGYRTSRR